MYSVFLSIHLKQYLRKSLFSVSPKWPLPVTGSNFQSHLLRSTRLSRGLLRVLCKIRSNLNNEDLEFYPLLGGWPAHCKPVFSDIGSKFDVYSTYLLIASRSTNFCVLIKILNYLRIVNGFHFIIPLIVFWQWEKMDG